MIFVGTDLVNVNSVSAFEAGASSGVPVFLEVNETYVVSANRQVLFSEEIDFSLGSEISLGQNSIMVGVI